MVQPLRPGDGEALYDIALFREFVGLDAGEVWTPDVTRLSRGRHHSDFFLSVPGRSDARGSHREDIAGALRHQPFDSTVSVAHFEPMHRHDRWHTPQKR